jgi:hypothetical protein
VRSRSGSLAGKKETPHEWYRPSTCCLIKRRF